MSQVRSVKMRCKIQGRLRTKMKLVPAHESFSKTELRKLAKLTKEPGGKTFSSMGGLLRDLKQH